MKDPILARHFYGTEIKSYSMRSNKTFKRKTRRNRHKKSILFVGILIAAILIVSVYFVFFNKQSISSGPPNSVLFRTSMGDILIQLRSDTPITSTNFKDLVQNGTYDGTIFDKVFADMMIRGGDPSGTGYGDMNLTGIQDEFTSTSNNTRGTIAMYSSTGAPNSASCQFFINVSNNTSLDGKFAVFGEVIKGMDVVDSISKVSVDSSYRPYASVVLQKATYFG